MIWIAQLLCPSRHSILACPFDEEAQFGTVKSGVEEMFRKGIMHRHCAICGSYELHWEMGETKFKNMGECYRAMRVEQKKQVLTRALLERAGQTFDGAKNN